MQIGAQMKLKKTMMQNKRGGEGGGRGEIRFSTPLLPKILTSS